MAKVKVYKVKVYDVTTDQQIISRIARERVITAHAWIL
jgi:hypothetical protein